jgi:hypothetical protein
MGRNNRRFRLGAGGLEEWSVGCAESPVDSNL